jgi:hypothetical protein
LETLTWLLDQTSSKDVLSTLTIWGSDEMTQGKYLKMIWKRPKLNLRNLIFNTLQKCYSNNIFCLTYPICFLSVQFFCHCCKCKFKNLFLNIFVILNFRRKIQAERSSWTDRPKQNLLGCLISNRLLIKKQNRRLFVFLFLSKIIKTTTNIYKNWIKNEN